MAASMKTERDIIEAPADAIRIVPLYATDEAYTPTAEAAAVLKAAPPKLTYRGGPLMAAVEVFTMFWGAAWQASQRRARCQSSTSSSTSS